MIVETQGGYSFVILGPGDVVDVLDEDIWYETKSLTTPLRIGTYTDREEAQQALRELERAYAQEFPSFHMPPKGKLPAYF